MNDTPVLKRRPFVKPLLIAAADAFTSQLKAGGRNVTLVRRPGRPGDAPAAVEVAYQAVLGERSVTIAAASSSYRNPIWSAGMRFPLLTVSDRPDRHALQIVSRFPLPDGTYSMSCPANGNALQALLKEHFVALLRRPLAELARP